MVYIYREHVRLCTHTIKCERATLPGTRIQGTLFTCTFCYLFLLCSFFFFFFCFFCSHDTIMMSSLYSILSHTHNKRGANLLHFAIQTSNIDTDWLKTRFFYITTKIQSFKPFKQDIQNSSLHPNATHTIAYKNIETP